MYRTPWQTSTRTSSRSSAWRSDNLGPRLLRRVVEDRLGGSEGHGHSGTELDGSGEPLAVDERAIGAAEILDRRSVVAHGDPRVAPRDVGRVEPHRAIHGPADEVLAVGE